MNVLLTVAALVAAGSLALSASGAPTPAQAGGLGGVTDPPAAAAPASLAPLGRGGLAVRRGAAPEAPRPVSGGCHD